MSRLSSASGMSARLGRRREWFLNSGSRRDVGRVRHTPPPRNAWGDNLGSVRYPESPYSRAPRRRRTPLAPGTTVVSSTDSRIPGSRGVVSQCTGPREAGWAALSWTLHRRLTSLRDTPKSCQSSQAFLVNLRCISTVRGVGPATNSRHRSVARKYGSG